MMSLSSKALNLPVRRISANKYILLQPKSNVPLLTEPETVTPLWWQP
jgi:hypothetical protein